MLHDSPASAGLVLSLVGLRVRVAGSTVLHDLDLSVRVGERVAVLGPNGAGKSTLLRALLGLTPAQWQTLTIGGVSITNGNSHRRARRLIAWVPQSPSFGEFPVTARELFDTVGARLEPQRVAERFGVQGLVDTPVREVSGGQRQRLLLARAFGQLTSRPGLLLADEPSTGIDGDSLAVLIDLLRASGVSALVVTHDDRLLTVCDRVLRLDAGRLVAA